MGYRDRPPLRPLETWRSRLKVRCRTLVKKVTVGMLATPLLVVGGCSGLTWLVLEHPQPLTSVLLKIVTILGALAGMAIVFVSVIYLGTAIIDNWSRPISKWKWPR